MLIYKKLLITINIEKEAKFLVTEAFCLKRFLSEKLKYIMLC